MKKHIVLFSLFTLFWLSCEEVPPFIPFDPPPPPPSERVVLMEEFTGVRCQSCPAGSAAIEDLLAKHSDRLVAVSFHAGEFSAPYPENNHDFQTTEGDAIHNLLGAPFGFPSAVINRKLFPGKFNLQIGQGDWAGAISDELAIPPMVLIETNSNFDSSSRNLNVEVNLDILENISNEDVRLSIMIKESGMIDRQKTPTGFDDNYVHKHVFRGMLTSATGTVISDPLTAGNRIVKNFNYTLPDEWNEEKCDLITFVSFGGDVTEVLQANQVRLGE